MPAVELNSKIIFDRPYDEHELWREISSEEILLPAELDLEKIAEAATTWAKTLKSKSQSKPEADVMQELASELHAVAIPEISLLFTRGHRHHLLSAKKDAAEKKDEKADADQVDPLSARTECIECLLQDDHNETQQVCSMKAACS